MWTRAQLKTNAKQVFYRNYWECVAISVLMAFFSFAGNSGINVNIDILGGHKETFHHIYQNTPEMWNAFMTFFVTFAAFSTLFIIAGILLKVFVGNVLSVGGMRFFIENRTKKARMGTILHPFRSGHYGNVVLILFLRDLYTALWSLLLIIPGVIKSYEYLMVPYILAENPGMDRGEAFLISRRMMDGEKWDAFVLDLSFLGWLLLSACTCGILNIFFVNPYREATLTELYTYNKIKAYNEGYIR